MRVVHGNDGCRGCLASEPPVSALANQSPPQGKGLLRPQGIASVCRPVLYPSFKGEMFDGNISKRRRDSHRIIHRHSFAHSEDEPCVGPPKMEAYSRPWL